MKLIVIHGPNLNLLGEREPEIYGDKNLTELNTELHAWSKKNSCSLRTHQSNSEGEIIDFIHRNRTWADGIILNPAAYTHYSIAIRDTITGVGIPTVEVHLTDINEREEFRKVSVIADVCEKQFSGKGFQSYLDGLEYFKARKA